MPDAPQPAVAAPALLSGPDTDAEIRRLQSRLAELIAGRSGDVLQPVTFVALAAGAHTVIDHPEMVLLTFPVHHEKVVRIAAEHATACQFAEGLVETLGGWDAVRARGDRHAIQALKRGCRRGKNFTGAVAQASAVEKKIPTTATQATLATAPVSSR